MLTLRPYQDEAKAAVYRHLRERDDNPCVVIPTAGGKTPVIASICKDAVGLWQGRVLILAHVRELLEQTVDKLGQVAPELLSRVGVYSAGLGSRETDCAITVAGVQSVFRRAAELGRFDLVIIDEAHMIPPDGDGMYRTLLAGLHETNPQLRVIGLTATPFRMRSGPICTPDGFLNRICYEVGVRELIVQGYLCPLITKAGINKADFSRLHVRAGEFVADEVEDLMDNDQLVEAACDEIVNYTSDRKAVLIFASGIQHGEHIVRVLREKHSITCGFVTGETPAQQRDTILEQFRDGRLKYLCNVNVLTTGFDAPNIDCVALVRPTLSAGLYYQMVGRGFRLHPSKLTCLILDFGENMLRHGPVDAIHVPDPTKAATGIAPTKECPKCHAVIATGYSHCPDCGYEFPPPDRTKHNGTASETGILSGQTTNTKHVVENVFYSVHKKRGVGPDAPKSMRVDYKLSWRKFQSEWICFEHNGYARQKAVDWWNRRSPDPVPVTAQEAVTLAQAGRLAPTHTITVRSVVGEDYDRIIDYELGDIPAPLNDQELPEDALDFPFGANAVTAEEEIPW